jgi:hypothetical protein
MVVLAEPPAAVIDDRPRRGTGLLLPDIQDHDGIRVCSIHEPPVPVGIADPEFVAALAHVQHGP